MSMQWLACEAWFSRKMQAHPAWFGFEDGVILEVRETAPENSGPVKHVPYLLPLLADTHVHVYMNPWPLDPKQRMLPGSEAFEHEVNNATQRACAALESGIGFLRDMGDPFGINLAVKKILATQKHPAPVLQAAGPALHRNGKYGRYLGIGFDSTNELSLHAQKLMDSGDVDFIKLVGTGIVNFKKGAMNQPHQVELEPLRKLMHCIHERGFQAAVHCSGEDGLDVCIKAGVDFIEHAYFISSDHVNKMIDGNLSWTPTFVPVQAQRAPECGWDADTKNSIERILETHGERFAMAVRAGIPGLTGTDAGSPGVPIGAGLHQELRQMETLGIAPARILRMASADAAERCRPQGYTGILEPGHPASFGIYGHPPWESIENLNSLQSVIAGGMTC